MHILQNQTTILLIESNSDWLKDVYAVLQAAGYDVFVAGSGDEGFCAARRIRPHLIICEAALPDISGVQLCYMIRADERLQDALFVLIGDESGQSEDFSLESFLAGANDCFDKNYNRQSLVAKIARLIALQSSEAELRQRSQNLRLSELSLMKIIEDTFNLIASLDPTFKYTVFDEFAMPQPERTFSKTVELKKRALKKNTEALERWKQSLQPKVFAGINKLQNGRREKVFYEIACRA